AGCVRRHPRRLAQAARSRQGTRLPPAIRRQQVPIRPAAPGGGGEVRAQGHARRAECGARRDRRVRALRGHRGAAGATVTPEGGPGPPLLRRSVRSRDRPRHGHQQGGGEEPHGTWHGRPAFRPGEDVMTQPPDEYGELLRRALRAEADSVVPSPDGLGVIRAKIERRASRNLFWWRAGAAAASAVLVAGTVVMVVPELRQRVVEAPIQEVRSTSSATPPDMSSTSRPASPKSTV